MRIHLSEEENIVLSAAAVRRLVASGSSDAAMLYLTLLLHHGSLSPEKLSGELRWSEERLRQAESALLASGLVNSRRPAVPESGGEERPDYTREDVGRQLESDQRFAQLTGNVEQLLGKKLSTPDLNILLGLYDYVGLPCDVIFLLVSHCTQRLQERYGEGRRPTLRQIEQEGYTWARMGLMDMESANSYLMKYAQKRTVTARYMQVMGLSQRPPSPTEETYLLRWAEMGFPAESVELAYDKTVLKCRELRWGYMNKILLSWHEKGLHTREEIAAGDGPRPKVPAQAETKRRSGENQERMKKYLEESRK